MSLAHHDVWACDLCGCGETRPHGKPPPGWRWFRVALGAIRHACPTCPVPPLSITAPLGQEAR